MKKYNKVELILFSRCYFTSIAQKELVKWLITNGQFVIRYQERWTKKLLPVTLNDTPPIYLS